MSSPFLAAEMVRPIVFADVADVRRQAASDEARDRTGRDEVSPLLIAAREEAERILTEAREGAAAIRDAAKAQGYEAGFAEGSRTGTAEAAERLAAEVSTCRDEMARLVEHVLDERRRFLEGFESEAVDFAWEIARKVVREEAIANPKVVLSSIQNAFLRLTEGRATRVIVNPDDLVEAQDARANFERLADGIEGLEIREDRRVDRGGCLVQTEGGVLDARIDTQFDQIRLALEEVREAA